MSNSKHTPGPWKVLWKHQEKDMALITEGDSAFVAECWKRNANLIAAAPDMLDLLQRVNAHFDYWAEEDAESMFCEQKDARGLLGFAITNLLEELEKNA